MSSRERVSDRHTFALPRDFQLPDSVGMSRRGNYIRFQFIFPSID